MRYFVKCSYKGTAYSGWQRQPHTPHTVQQYIEDALSLVTRVETPILGCGRTDAGVHASEFYFHFDTEFTDTDMLLYKINQIIPNDIYCHSIHQVKPDAHARFDAIERGYTYFMSKAPDPFRLDTVYTHLKKEDINIAKLQSAAQLVMGNKDFEAFCKAHTDVKTKICSIKESQWIETESGYHYRVRADRFLRGMIRLIVGMCINVSRDRLTIEEVNDSLVKKKRLSLDWSVPGKGLFLDKVVYPKEIFID